MEGNSYRRRPQSGMWTQAGRSQRQSLEHKQFADILVPWIQNVGSPCVGNVDALTLDVEYWSASLFGTGCGGSGTDLLFEEGTSWLLVPHPAKVGGYKEHEV